MAWLFILFALFMVRPAPCWGQLASFQLVIQWPNAYCKTHLCRTPIPQMFTIHGMFGVDNNGRPLPCPVNARRSMTYPEIQSLINIGTLLDQYWPNLENGPNENFWDYEFAKHASCFNIPPVEYFSHAIFLKIQLDNVMKTNILNFQGLPPAITLMANVDPTQAVLLLNGVAPDAVNFYHAYQFAGVFSSFIGVTVQVKCNDDSQHQNQMLEIYFCISLNWQLLLCNPVKYIDCATSANSVRFTTVPYTVFNPSTPIAPVPGGISDSTVMAPTEVIGVNSTSTPQLP